MNSPDTCHYSNNKQAYTSDQLEVNLNKFNNIINRKIEILNSKNTGNSNGIGANNNNNKAINQTKAAQNLQEKTISNQTVTTIDSHIFYEKYKLADKELTRFESSLETPAPGLENLNLTPDQIIKSPNNPNHQVVKRGYSQTINTMHHCLNDTQDILHAMSHNSSHNSHQPHRIINNSYSPQNRNNKLSIKSSDLNQGASYLKNLISAKNSSNHTGSKDRIVKIHSFFKCM